MELRENSESEGSQSRIAGFGVVGREGVAGDYPGIGKQGSRAKGGRMGPSQLVYI